MIRPPKCNHPLLVTHHPTPP